MKKWIFGFLAILLLLIAAFYIFIPSSIRISASTSFSASHEAATRLLASEAGWAKWWPNKSGTANGDLQYQGTTYVVEKKMFQSFDVNIKTTEQKYQSLIVLLPVRRDSLQVEWKTTVSSGNNPLERLDAYRKSQRLETQLQQLLDSFASYVKETKNIYGVPITETVVRDSIILVHSVVTSNSPGPEQVYSMLDAMQSYLSTTNAKTTNNPMLNVDSAGGKFMVRVGLPIDTDLNVTGTPYSIKRMVRGFLLQAEVKGGPASIQNALKNLEVYMADYNRRSPAIPYQSLVTNRAATTDTSGWVTRIFYPVY